MSGSFRLIFIILALVVGLWGLTACQDDGDKEVVYSLQYKPSPNEPPRRPGTTGVRIKPPKKIPLPFKLEHGSALNILGLMADYPGDQLTAVFTVPCGGGRVRDVDVTYLDHKAAAKRVKSVISSWIYSPTMCGTMTLVIRLTNGNVQIDTSQLHRNGEITPRMGALYND